MKEILVDVTSAARITNNAEKKTQLTRCLATAKGHIATATYRIKLTISIACWTFPILYNGSGDASKIASSSGSGPTC